MSIQDDPTYQADIKAASDARDEALYLVHSDRSTVMDRAAFIKATDAVFAVYHQAIFAAIDKANERRKASESSGAQFGLPPVVGDVSLN